MEFEEWFVGFNDWVRQSDGIKFISNRIFSKLVLDVGFYRGIYGIGVWKDLFIPYQEMGFSIMAIRFFLLCIIIRDRGYYFPIYPGFKRRRSWTRYVNATVTFIGMRDSEISSSIWWDWTYQFFSIWMFAAGWNSWLWQWDNNNTIVNFDESP